MTAHPRSCSLFGRPAPEYGGRSPRVPAWCSEPSVGAVTAAVGSPVHVPFTWPREDAVMGRARGLPLSGVR